MKRIMVMVAGMLLSHPAHAAEITVLSGGAVEPGLKAAAAAFEKQSGHTVKITFNTAPAMRKRVAAGDTFDVVIAPLLRSRSSQPREKSKRAASTSGGWAREWRSVRALPSPIFPAPRR